MNKFTIEDINKKPNMELTADNIVKVDAKFYQKLRKDEDFLRDFLRENPTNVNPDIIYRKIRLIDLLNSTRLDNHPGFAEFLANKICGITDIDDLIRFGDPKAVDLIALENDNFCGVPSFASKYCYYHQIYCYDRNDYPIYDMNVRKMLLRYISKRGLRTFMDNLFTDSDIENPYAEFKKIIEKTLSLYEIKAKNKEFNGRAFSMFDHFMWYTYKFGEESTKDE